MRWSKTILCLICIASLSACSVNPVVRWEAPKSSEVPNYTLDYAKTYARAARRAYQDGIDQQTVLSTTLSSGLIGLGGVLAALAAYHAHADALIGTALFGGTAYALGNWNLSKPRVLVLQAGVEGINCSLRAIAPLDMNESDLRDLNVALAGIDQLVPSVQAAVEATRGALSRAVEHGLTGNLVNEATTQIAEAEKGILAANETLVAGRQLATTIRRAGTELINTVDRIDAAVNKAIIDTIPDLTAVPKVIGGLAGFAGALAPGAGLESKITTALAGYDAKAQGLGVTSAIGGGPSSEDLQALAVARTRLRTESAKLANAVATVRSRIAGYENTAAADSLKDCGVAEISLALHATPDTVKLTGGVDETSTIIVTGGIKPYVAILQQAPVDGLTVQTPPPFESTVRIIATKTLATANKTFAAVIMDSSTPPKTIPVSIVVGEKQANGTSGGGAAVPNLATLASDIKNLGSRKFGDADLTIASSVPDDAKNQVVVTLSCKPPNPAKCLDPSAVRDFLLSTTLSGAALGRADPKEKEKVVLVSKPPKCLCTKAAPAK